MHTSPVIDKDGKPVYNIEYSYDHKGNIVNETRDGAYPLTKIYKYNSDNTLERSSYTVGGQSLIYEYEMDNTPDKRNSKATLPFGVEQKFAYDGLGRTREITLGRITKINDTKFGGHIYTYDYRGFLTKADNETFGYDKNGNITNYNGTVFGYDSVIKDKLVSVGGNAVTYASAASLNPTSWNGRSYGFEGRRLKSFNFGGKSCTYEYDEQGHRIFKSVNGAETSYTYSGDKLVIEDGANGKLFFLYDENGELYGFVKDEKKYFYIKDITGTILGIADESGALVGKYSYTAYGKCTITQNVNNIATINPFRFKCYYYDAESGMYYCHTRYLVPEWGRWLNFDHCAYLQLANVNEMNLFAYCSNNPIMYSDPEGTRIKWWQIALIAVAVILVIVGATILTGGAAGGALVANGAAAAIANTGAATVVGGAAVATGVVVGGLAVADVLNEIINSNIWYARTGKSGGYYGERWPGDPHKPDHVHLRGNGTDIRIGRDGNPLPGEDKLSAQARKALTKLWDQFIELFSRW